MGEKLLAGLVTAAVIAPVCALCILGPAVLASVFTGIAAWLGGFDPVLAVGLALAAAIGAYGILRRGRERHSSVSPRGEIKDER